MTSPAALPGPVGTRSLVVRAVARRPSVLDDSRVVTLLLALIGVTVAALLVAASGATWTASSQVLVRDRDVAAVLLGASSSGASPGIDNALAVAQSGGFAQRVATLAGTTRSEVESHLVVTQSSGADVLVFTARASQAQSVVLADRAASAFVTYYVSLLVDPEGLGVVGPTGQGQQVLSDLARIRALESVSPSAVVLSTPGDPVRSGLSLVKASVAGGLGGLGIGLVLAAWRARERRGE